MKKFQFLFILFGLCLGLGFLSINDTYAVSNLSVTLDANNNYAGSNVPVFSGCNDSNCLSQYKYFHIKCENCPYTYSNMNLKFRNTTSFRAYIDTYYDVSDSSILEFMDGFWSLGNQKYIFELLTDLPSDCPPAPSGSLTIDENGTFDVTDYASVSVDVDQNVTEIIEDPISNDFQKVFFEIVKNIIPAFGILLVVWFGIDMLSSLIFGRGR